jgi:nucleoside-diphosphate-sugar epimerase
MRFLLHSKPAAVTGGLGLIGSFVCDELLTRGARVVVVEDESKGGWIYCSHLRGRGEHRKGTLEDAAFAAEALGARKLFGLRHSLRVRELHLLAG